MTSPHVYRAEADRAMATKLMLHPSVRPLLLGLAEEERALGTRRSLLAQALRLTPQVAPQLCAIAEECRRELEVETEVEVYVYASPSFNAACTAPEGGRVFVMMSSSLVEAFEADELRFVMGHELGHHVYDHHAIPVHLLLQPEAQIPAAVVLQLMSWQRYAEISADRAGMVCAGGLEPCARSLFKLSSGLTHSPTDAQIAAYLDQAQELYAEADRQEGNRSHADWMSTHPFSPIRLSAARAFGGSSQLVDGGVALAQVEVEIQQYLGLMEASYLDEQTDEAESMRRVLFAAGVVLAAADGDVSGLELDHLVTLLGRKRVPDTIDPEALRQDLPRRLSRCNEVVRPARRAQLIHDLAGIARADCAIDVTERALLIGWAAELGVDELVVHEALRAPCELD